MNRNKASQFCKAELIKHNLKDWKVRLNQDINNPYLGLCDHGSKSIILNAHHCDIHGEAEVINTIRHEIAHALVGRGHAHNETWQNMAKAIGCDNTLPCSHLNIPDHIIDAIRSGDNVEVIVEEETHVIRKISHKTSKIIELCPDCNKPAIELFAIETLDKDGNTCKLITLKCFHIIKKIIPRGTAFDSMVSNYWQEHVKVCNHKWIKNQCELCKEFKLYNFQIVGARLAEHGLAIQKGFNILDDMGLGKTVQGLAIPRFHKQYLPFLVVTKSAIKFQWLKQILRWLGPDYLGQIISTSKDFLIPGLKSYIIPYDLLRRMPEGKLDKLGIKLVILDECQQIKNVDSSRTQAVRKLLKDVNIKVIGLSGTPWKNRGSEFFPILNITDPIKFHSFQNFLDNHVEYYYEGNKRKQGGIRNPVKFKEYTNSLLVRREYNEVMDEFPEINKTKLPVQLDEIGQSSYDEATSEFVAWYNDYVLSGEEEQINGIEMLAKMSRMRHITGLAKIPATLTFIEQFIEETLDRKIVIFVHHKDVGELLYRALINKSKTSNPDWAELASQLINERVKVFKYTSELSDSERFEMQEAFNKNKRCIMIASTLACGEGVDLQTCYDSILHERQWNPQNEDQATPGRFRRIGQVSSVINITVPESEGTIDEHLDGIIERKRKYFHDAMNKSELKQSYNESDLGRELAAIIVERFNKKNPNRPKTNITKMAVYTPSANVGLL